MEWEKGRRGEVVGLYTWGGRAGGLGDVVAFFNFEDVEDGVLVESNEESEYNVRDPDEASELGYRGVCGSLVTIGGRLI